MHQKLSKVRCYHYHVDVPHFPHLLYGFCQTFHIASYYFEVKTALIIYRNFPNLDLVFVFSHQKIRSTQE